MAEIIGTASDDTTLLTGGSEGDEIFGLAGDDLLQGQAGGDTLDGGSGDDILFGGPEGEPTGEGETVILDFQTRNPNNVNFLLVKDILIEDGFQLQGDLGGDSAFFFTYGTGHEAFESEGSTALVLFSTGGTTTLTKDPSVGDDSTFTLESIQLDAVMGAGTIKFTGITSSGEVTQTFTLDGEEGFKTFEFGNDFTDLVSVSWDQGPTGFLYQFDNIKLTIGTGEVDDGNDVLVGGTGDDELFGGTGDDELDGGTGDDLLVGGDGNDNALVGGDGDDELFGGTGDDELYGENGDDLLVGGDGQDMLTGGSGDDTFVFGPGSGDDTITDFDLANDILSLTDGLEIDTTEDVNGDTDTLVTFDSGDTVTLLGVTGITEGDLVLA